MNKVYKLTMRCIEITDLRSKNVDVKTLECHYICVSILKFQKV